MRGGVGAPWPARMDESAMAMHQTWAISTAVAASPSRIAGDAALRPTLTCAATHVLDADFGERARERGMT